MVQERFNDATCYKPEKRIYRVVGRRPIPHSNEVDLFYVSYEQILLLEGGRTIVGIGLPCERCAFCCQGDIIVVRRQNSHELTDDELNRLVDSESVYRLISFDRDGYPRVGSDGRYLFGPRQVVGPGEYGLYLAEFYPNAPEVVFAGLVKVIDDITC